MQVTVVRRNVRANIQIRQDPFQVGRNSLRTSEIATVRGHGRACVRSHFRPTAGSFGGSSLVRRPVDWRRASLVHRGAMDASPSPLVTLPLDPISPRLPIGEPFTPAMAARAGIGRTALDRLLREGRLCRLLRGLHVDARRRPRSRFAVKVITPPCRSSVRLPGRRKPSPNCMLAGDTYPRRSERESAPFPCLDPLAASRSCESFGPSSMFTPGEPHCHSFVQQTRQVWVRAGVPGPRQDRQSQWQWKNSFTLPSGRTLKCSTLEFENVEPSEPVPRTSKVNVPFTVDPFWLKPPQTVNLPV